MSGVEAEVLAWLGAQAERRIDTACARVFLAGDIAWKVKRPVNPGYGDFSTLELRRWALERELAFNRAAAPDIYRAVRCITRSPDGGLHLEGAGETVEHVLEMRRFDEGAVLAACPDRLDGELSEALGRTVARLHAAAPPRPDGGLPALTFTTASNAALLREAGDQLDQDRVERLTRLTLAELDRQTPCIVRRAAAGFARRCHGDLHLGNILLEDGRPVLFDCLEFNDVLSDVDVLYDLGFLLMDLDFRGRRDAAVRVLAAYVDEAARAFADDLWDGLEVLPLMLSVRATVRAHVSAHSGDAGTARAYVEAAIAHLTPAAPVLAVVGGVSGSGKTTFARAAAPHLGASPGAVILRTDEVRKRLLGVARTEPLPDEAYTPQADARTYAALFDAAGRLLRAGRGVVLDATFLDPDLRVRAEALATACGARFRPAWMAAPVEVLEARIADRRGDASDATAEVARRQLARLDAPADWPRIDARALTETSVAAWLGASPNVAEPVVRN